MIRNLVPSALAVVVLAVVLVAAGCSAADTPDPNPPELPGPAGVAPASQAGHPNIVYVLTDDLDTSLLRYMPHVAQLAARGASFADDDDADTLCCPSRSSIFTGAFPHDTGVFTNTGPDGGYGTFHARNDEADTDSVALQKAGYTTAMMGKYLNGYQPTDGPEPGWNEWDVAGNGYQEFNYDLNVNGTIAHHGHDDADYMPDVLGQRGSDFITAQSAARRPFFLEVATFAPHAPYTPAPRHSNDFPGLQAPRDPSFNQPDAPAAPAWLRDRTPLTQKQVNRLDTGYRKRAQASLSADDMLGQLEATLDRTGQTANTEIVFNSDNGYHMGQHELTAGKQTTFATDLVVPLIAAGPGVVHRTITQTAQNIDVAPTFVDLAHAPPLPIADGHSLVPLLIGADPPDWRNAARRAPRPEPRPERPRPHARQERREPTELHGRRDRHRDLHRVRHRREGIPRHRYRSLPARQHRGAGATRPARCPARDAHSVGELPRRGRVLVRWTCALTECECGSPRRSES